MKIKKILNQNAVLVDDHGEEKVAIGKGVGFSKQKNDLIFAKDIEHLFVMEPEGQQKLQNLLNQIDEKYFFAAEHIIDHAETVLMEKLNEHIFVALTDHIAFAAQNITNGIVIRNKLLSEIEVLYNEEFAIAQWAVDYLNRTLNIPYGYDEAGYIAIHIHSARMGKSNNYSSIREVTIISEVINIIAQEVGVDIYSKEMALDYSRLANHLRLLLQRYQNQRYASLDLDIIEMVRSKYTESYQVAKKIRVFLMKNYQLAITTEELGYLAIHVERLRGAKNQRKGED
ncbi:PRD domain-containing protein [Enterococcus pallens]|uniref:BglG family transcriptional antiterminator n=1 Tax=Enterococcus pallens ATCC BAA-351 TaxID=1158607 RepID=R2T6Z2_9ENTE|nr:PRD domain-containing protein [Enterococcus pallens]EOH96009.1 BglG family transcriptional antiterminator [Enterococcus pallens ATCC BAA-351]EOU14726.1 BglG family transcriptional antiterminator [Enterococcus pallens ATCC BAA-351]OJG76627.1 BglG family transcriptional antiterminator [Enterococcus pallens]